MLNEIPSYILKGKIEKDLGSVSLTVTCVGFLNRYKRGSERDVKAGLLYDALTIPLTYKAKSIICLGFKKQTPIIYRHTANSSYKSLCAETQRWNNCRRLGS